MLPILPILPEEKDPARAAGSASRGGPAPRGPGRVGESARERASLGGALALHGVDGAQITALERLDSGDSVAAAVLFAALLDSVDRARNLGVSIREMPTGKNGHIELSSIHSVLWEMDVNALYCEGGPTLAQSFLDLGLVDYLFRYRSPKIFDGPDAMPAPDLDSLTIRDSLSQSLGEDHLEHGFL